LASSTADVPFRQPIVPSFLPVSYLKQTRVRIRRSFSVEKQDDFHSMRSFGLQGMSLIYIRIGMEGGKMKHYQYKINFITIFLDRDEIFWKVKDIFIETAMNVIFI